MSFPEDQIAEVKQLCPDVQLHEEAGCAYLLLPGLNLPDGCSPDSMDALLCPTSRDGYPSRPTIRIWVYMKQVTFPSLLFPIFTLLPHFTPLAWPAADDRCTSTGTVWRTPD